MIVSVALRQYVAAASQRRTISNELERRDRVQTTQAGKTRQNEPSHPIGDDTLLTSVQARAEVGHVSTMCIWRWQRNPRVQFPPPDVIINGRNYWYAGSIRRWKASREIKAAVHEKSFVHAA
jgi:hypothetical protein